ncbi:hypothetical protein CHS0354_009135 [Potamilus streckersoni]|uniref:Uncharacterized protein n=1 Tax=Potamilus streckersoni TaxID=2493646 RepID=A0AAE0SS22_9BIVA|nr:hypothetical protein CHS0354_009135 [Potamilus streckersoni]
MCLSEVRQAEASFATDAAILRSTMLSNATNDPVVRPNETVLVTAGFNLFTIDSVVRFAWGITGKDGQVGWWTGGNFLQRANIPGCTSTEVLSERCQEGEGNTIFTGCQRLDDIGVINDDNLQLTVTNTGDVVWEPPGLYTTHCEIDITYYPFDRQQCVIELTSWSMTKDQLELDHASSNVDTEDLRTNGEWIIVSTSVKDEDLQDTKPDGTVETLSQLDFILILERRPAFYAINFILPIILSSFLSCVVFLVPIHAGEKVSYILTMILAIAVLLTLIADSLPHTSLTASVLGIYLAITMFLSVLCAFITVLLLNIFHNKKKVDTTSSFYKLTLFVATILSFQGCKRRCKKRMENPENKVFPNGMLPSKKINNVVEGVNEMDTQADETSISVDNCEKWAYTWAEMANIWDRFCFWVFITFMSLCTLSFLIALAVGAKK